MKSVKIEYFSLPIRNQEELRKQYRNLSKKYHPDLNQDTDTTRIMQKVNLEYDYLLDQVLSGKDFSEEERAEEIRIDEALRDIIDQVVIIPGITIEIIGSWIWITGNTYPVRNALKEIGFFFSKNKTAWYYHAEPYRKRSKKRFSLDDLRRMFDSVSIDGKPTGKRAISNPSTAQISEMWKLAGKEPKGTSLKVIVNPDHVREMSRLAGKEPKTTGHRSPAKGKTGRATRLGSRPVAKRKNPGTPPAERTYRVFNHMAPDKIRELNIPIEDGLAEIGQCVRIDYESEKMIFEKDKQTGVKTKRIYTHSFTRKANMYLTADRKHIIIKMSIPASARGIMQ